MRPRQNIFNSYILCEMHRSMLHFVEQCALTACVITYSKNQDKTTCGA